ncbi:MAG TPA: glycosyltransferase [Acetobacteraceae bacterium]|jgi:glycosyltransferase involved in cell wall biosynthesis
MATGSQTLLVYRDRIGVPSEIEFLRRQYVGFTTLTPIWVSRHVMPDAGQLGAPVHRLGGSGVLGGLRRAAFGQFGIVPPLDLPPHARVLHAQFARGGALALPLVRSLGLHMVVTLHGGDIAKAKNFRHTMLARRWPGVIAATARFVCVSGAVAETARRRGVPQEKLVVLPIGVEMPEAPPPPPAGPPYHLFVGRFVAKKGIGVLADAVRRLRAAGDATPVVCIGDGPLRPVLETLVRETDGVELTGWLPPHVVQARMAAAWAVLVPSVVAEDGDAEGLPSVIPEAMAQACPVIGSHEGGIAEAIADARTGVLVPPGDATALADAMHRLAYDAPLRHGLGQAAFAYARAHLNARVQSAALEKLLLEVGS